LIVAISVQLPYQRVPEVELTINSEPLSSYETAEGNPSRFKRISLATKNEFGSPFSNPSLVP
jgi:hypothetical protein